MAWQVRAISREVGLAPSVFDAPFIDGYRVIYRHSTLEEQILYHDANASTLRSLDRLLGRLSRAGFLLIASVLLFVLICLLFRHLFGWPDYPLGWLLLLEAGLPTVGGALAAIRGQAELERA